MLRPEALSAAPAQEILWEELVKPANGELTLKDAVDGSIPLSGMDHALLMHSTAYAFRFETLLNAELIREGLSMALFKMPVFSSRLDLNSGLPFRFVHLTAGVPFKVVTDSSDISRLPDSSTCLPRWEELNLFPESTEPLTNPDEPLMSVRLSLFVKHNVSFIGVNFHHSVADGSSACLFMQMWSYHCGRLESSQNIQHWPKSFAPSLYRLETISSGQFHLNDISESSKQNMWTEAKMRPCERKPTDYNWLELRLDLCDLRNVKAQISEQLPVNGAEWVSSFEVIVAMLSAADVVSTGRTRQLQTKVVTNMRGRTPLMANNTFGNGIVITCLGTQRRHELPNYPVGSLKWLAAVAARFHSDLREKLEDTKWLSEIIASSELALASGKIFNFDALVFEQSSDSKFINSWTAFPWLEIDMGSGTKASTMGRRFPIITNYWMMYPSSLTSWAILVSSVNVDANKRLAQAIEGLHLPFKIISAFD